MIANRIRLAVLFILVAFSVQFASAASVPMNVDGMEIELLSVERKGNVLTVKWAVKNSSTARDDVNFKLIGSTPTTYLVDEDSGTKYFALTDKEGRALATESEYEGIWEHIEPGKSKRFWAKFPAPPPAVKSINVFFSDAEPFEGITIVEKK